MKPTVGIICEYDPFHRGHARQFALVREQLPDARIVCVMSGCFTQRGSPALFSPAFRARAALEAGASLVVELPCAFAVREAENFALGGVSVLHSLGFITHLSFGCETDNLPLLQTVADVLAQPTPPFFAALRDTLSRGQPFAAAQAAAISAALAGYGGGMPDSSHGSMTDSSCSSVSDGLPDSARDNLPDDLLSHTPDSLCESLRDTLPDNLRDRMDDSTHSPTSGSLRTSQLKNTPDAMRYGDSLQSSQPAHTPTAQNEQQNPVAQARTLEPQPIAAMLAKPNNILAICYLRALHRLRSPLTPLPVRRVGEYHASSLATAGYPSASATRKAFLAGDIAAAEAACGYPLAGETHHRPEALDTLLLHTLRASFPEILRALPDCTEGLENRLAQAARSATTRTELLTLLKTRRYAYARLNRLVSHTLLGVTAELLAAYPLPPYARLLGFRRDDRACLTLLNQSSIPMIAKAADGDGDHPLYQLDARAYDLWALGAGLPAGLMYRQGVQIV